MFTRLPDDLARALAAAEATLGSYSDVRYLEETDSTNDVALALAAQGAAEGTSVLADTQRRGRGRRGRDWHSPAAAGLYLSVVVRPRAVESGPSLVTLAAGVALAEAVNEVSGLPVELKWPNDLVIGRPWRKLGGVLTEATTSGGRLEGIVVGVGLNVLATSYPRELGTRATAIESELGRPIDRAVLLVALLDGLRRIMTVFGDRPGEAVVSRWRRYGQRGIAGAAVSWTDGPRMGHGRAVDVDDDGALIVERDGRRARIISGEVVWEGGSVG